MTVIYDFPAEQMKGGPMPLKRFEGNVADPLSLWLGTQAPCSRAMHRTQRPRACARTSRRR